MKKFIFIFIVCVLVGFQFLSYSNDSQPLKLKGFFLGMEKSEVNEIFQMMKSKEAAKYVSIESSEYRDLIMLDNEFSSMGNKIELGYDENGKVEYIKFQYKTVAILFEAGTMSAEEFVQKFAEDYNIQEMKFEDMGIVKTWSFTDEVRNFSLSIDDNKNITLKIM